MVQPFSLVNKLVHFSLFARRTMYPSTFDHNTASQNKKKTVSNVIFSSIFQYIVVVRDSVGFFVPGFPVKRRWWSGEDVSVMVYSK